MGFPTPFFRFLIWVFFFFFFSSICTVSVSLSETRSSEAGLFCGASNMAAGALIPKFVEAMNQLSAGVMFKEWGTAFGDPSTFAFAQCHQDLSMLDCQHCYAKIRAMLPRCLPASSARIYLDGCYLRYDNRSFFNDALGRDDAVQCEGADVEDFKYGGRIEQVLKNVTERAVLGGGFAVAERDGNVSVYALAQCWNTIQVAACRQCLEDASSLLSTCAPGLGGRAMYAGCYLRYSTEKFFDDGGIYDMPAEATRMSRNGIYTVVTVAFVAVLIIFSGYLGHVKLRKEKRGPANFMPISPAIKSHFRFEYEVLEKATNFFDTSMRLGQGGAGSVYKAALPDGKVVAVKRLRFDDDHRQWTDGFFNEVNLISGIEHKNLVRLFGCSYDGNESLLVYEYVPNKALDHFLFEKKKVQTLNWQQRFHIILGIAEGLAYLHGGCKEKIVHRDIKSANILLDENLNPKIADFGLARGFAPNKTHTTTLIAGTLGYLAPEYLNRGQLTEKADVYSFGVLSLEIVTGRRSSIYTQGSGSILLTVWKHYRLCNITQSVDPSLEEEFPIKQASTVLQIGLLCTQTSGSLRPRMLEVVQMLVDPDFWVPPPQQAPYLNASLLSVDGSSRSLMSIPGSNGDMEAETWSSLKSSSYSKEDETKMLSTSEPSPCT